MSEFEKAKLVSQAMTLAKQFDEIVKVIVAKANALSGKKAA